MRQLSRRYDPVGDVFTFDRMTALRTERCKNIGELPAAIEMWIRDLAAHERHVFKELIITNSVPSLTARVPPGKGIRVLDLLPQFLKDLP